MKKKIVYISGAEAFNVNDVRAAFEEVRATMGLDSDTILFGVPVDSEVESGAVDEVVQEPKIETVAAHETSEISQPEPEYTESVESTVVPILSVLGGGADEPTVVCEQTHEIETINESVDPVAQDDITEMLDDDLPVDAGEKTLEELLETMAPLDEDVHPEPVEVAENNIDDETDATLENLASEFATAQIKTTTPKKSSERGRIGKLKNILPFKNKKRDDSGLMGDLFGWAGVAANDEDFTIPGFFTNAVGNK